MAKIQRSSRKKTPTNEIFPLPFFFGFRAGDDRFLFHRDTLSILGLPKRLNTDDISKIKKLLKKLEAESGEIAKPALRTIALNLTNNCNFACKYCFASHGNYGKPGLIMDKAVATRAIVLLFKSVRQNRQKRASIAFFGGEPLLAWETIREVVEYGKKNKPQGISLRFLLTTNASLMTMDKVNL